MTLISQSAVAGSRRPMPTKLIQTPVEKGGLVKPKVDPGTSSVPRRRWGVALLLGFGVLVNYFDRVNLSVSRDALQASFGISAVMFGYLSSAYISGQCESHRLLVPQRGTQPGHRHV